MKNILDHQNDTTVVAVLKLQALEMGRRYKNTPKSPKIQQKQFEIRSVNGHYNQKCQEDMNLFLISYWQW